MTKHFVEFLSPGTFLAETSERPIASCNVDEAKRMVRSIKERYGATPYGFRFLTRSRGAKDLDSKIVKRSGVYFLGGKIETQDDIRRRGDPKEAILLSNMECNGWEKVVTNSNSWKWTQLLGPDDVVLQWP